MEWKMVIAASLKCRQVIKEVVIQLLVVVLPVLYLNIYISMVYMSIYKLILFSIDFFVIVYCLCTVDFHQDKNAAISPGLCIKKYKKF